MIKHSKNCTFYNEINSLIKTIGKDLKSLNIEFTNDKIHLFNISDINQSNLNFQFKYCPYCGCTLDDEIIETENRLTYLEERISYLWSKDEQLKLDKAIEEYRILANKIN